MRGGGGGGEGRGMMTTVPDCNQKAFASARKVQGLLEGDKVKKEVDNGGKMFILYHLQILRL